MEHATLTDYFLIAMPSMVDSFFAKTVVYICEHNEKGALGIIVNRPIDMNLLNLFERVDIPPGGDTSIFSQRPVYFGGPVQTDRGFVLHRPIGEWQSTIPVAEGIGFTSSRDVLQAVATEGNPSDFLVTLGFSGWSAGQLEQEIVANSWLTVPATPHILFDTQPELRLQAAIQLLGIDFARLSRVAGHA